MRKVRPGDTVKKMLDQVTLLKKMLAYTIGCTVGQVTMLKTKVGQVTLLKKTVSQFTQLKKCQARLHCLRKYQARLQIHY